MMTVAEWPVVNTAAAIPKHYNYCHNYHTSFVMAVVLIFALLIEQFGSVFVALMGLPVWNSLSRNLDPALSHCFQMATKDMFLETLMRCTQCFRDCVCVRINTLCKFTFSSSSSSFNFKAHEKSKSIQIKAGTTRQETALTVALKIHINTSIKHQTVNKAYNIRKTQQQK